MYTPLEDNRQSVGCLGEGMGLTSSPPNLLYCLVSCCFKVYCHILCYNTLVCCASARCSGQTALQSSGHCPCNSYCAAQSVLPCKDLLPSRSSRAQYWSIASALLPLHTAPNDLEITDAVHSTPGLVLLWLFQRPLMPIVSEQPPRLPAGAGFALGKLFQTICSKFRSFVASQVAALVVLVVRYYAQ